MRFYGFSTFELLSSITICSIPSIYIKKLIAISVVEQVRMFEHPFAKLIVGVLFVAAASVGFCVHHVCVYR